MKECPSVWIFDVENRDFPRLLSLFPREKLWYVKPPWIKVAALQAIGDPEAWINLITDLIRANQFLRDGAVSILSPAISELYFRRGCLEGSRNWPKLGHLLVDLKRRKFGASSRSAGYLESATRAVGSLLDCLGSTINVTESMPMGVLRRQNILFDCSELNIVALEFFICLLLEASGGEELESIPRVVVIDEANLIFNRQKQARVDLGEPPLQAALRRMRKRGNFTILIDQHPSALPGSVRASIGNQIVLPMMDGMDCRCVGVSLGLTHEQARQIPLLPMRTGIFRNQEIGQATLFRIPELTFPPRPDMLAVEMEMRQILRGLPFRSGDDDGEGLFDKEIRIQEPAQPAVKGEVSLDAMIYLKGWNDYKNMFRPLGVFDKQHGISNAAGNRLREELVTAKFIRVHTIVTGKRGAPHKTVEITREGYAELEKAGEKVRKPKGKGSFEAKHWAAQIARWLVRAVAGCKPEIEFTVNGKAIDVACEIAGMLVAFEVSLSEKWVTQNLVKDVAVGCESVVFCALNEEMLGRIKAKLENELGEDEEASGLLKKASFELLKKFLP